MGSADHVRSLPTACVWFVQEDQADPTPLSTPMAAAVSLGGGGGQDTLTMAKQLARYRHSGRLQAAQQEARGTELHNEAELDKWV